MAKSQKIKRLPEEEVIIHKWGKPPMLNPTLDLTEEQVIEELRIWIAEQFYGGFCELENRTNDYSWTCALSNADQVIAKLHSLNLIRSPSEIRVLEVAAMERVFDGIEKLELDNPISDYETVRPEYRDTEFILWVSKGKYQALKFELLGEQDKEG